MSDDSASPMSLRVLQVSAFFPAHGGGIEAVAGHLARALAEANVSVVWMAGGAEEETPLELEGHCLRIERAGSIDLLERRLGLPWPVWSPRSLVSLWRRAREADVVHVHDFLYFSSLFAMACAALLRKPVVLTQHIGDISFRSILARNLLNVLNRSLGRFLMQRVSQVVFVGQPVMEYFNGFVRFRRPPELIHNGVDHELYRPVIRNMPVAADVNLLFVGRFVEKKGIAFLRSCLDLPGVNWTFIGWGPLSPVTWEELPDNTRVLEGLRAEELVPYFQQADLFVLPSTGEGFPLVLQEALACGTPVLVSSEVAAAFPLRDPRCVFDVEMRAVNAVSELRFMLARLASSCDELTDARVHAAHLAKQWSWERCVQRYREVYSALLES